MSRWIVRFVALLMLIAFFLLFANLQKRLIELQNSNRTTPATPSP